MIEETDYLQTLSLPQPVRSQNGVIDNHSSLEMSWATRQALVHQPIEWQLAVAMAGHERLGAVSPLNCLEDLMVRFVRAFCASM